MTSEAHPTKTTQFPLQMLLVVLLAALVARIALLASGTVSFHADEAVVGLMARHILQGERPTFFYGQPYMGSLDAWLIALGFQLLGQSVMTIRIVESLLYMLVVALGFTVAWRFSGRVMIATIAGFMLAVPTVNVALYTTATLGGYNETLIFGSILLLLAYDVTSEHANSVWRWALMGLVTGVGWWTNGLIVAYVLPIGLLIMVKLIRERSIIRLAPMIGLALVAFFIGSSPWWIFDFNHNHAALGTFLNNRQSGEFEGIGIGYVPPVERALGLFVIGLPTLVGMRFPWSDGYFLPLVGIVAIVIYLAAAYRLRRHSPLRFGARALTIGMPGLFFILFVASTFGADPTGRYFLPLSLPLGILIATLAVGLMPENEARLIRRILPLALVLLVIGYQAAGQITAATSESTGFTTQFDPISHIPNDHDAELVDFLESHDLKNGYSNYWVSFRLAFLSDERLQYSSALPYKADLSYNPADNRYRPYQEAADNAERVAYITTNLPALDIYLENVFAAEGLTYQQTQIGLFHIFYDFSAKPVLAAVQQFNQ